MILNEQFFEYLIEKQCLACYPYLETLKEIVKYSNDFIKNNSIKNGSWQFEIPLSITKKIGIFEELHIKMFISNILNYNHPEDIGMAESTIQQYSYLEIANGKFYTPQTILVFGYAENGNIYEKTLYANIAHELNHKIEQLFRELKTGSSINPIYIQAACYKKLENVIFSKDKKINDFIHFILYRLFETTELNALVSHVSMELLAMHTTNKDDIEKTSPYLFYNYISSNLSLLDNLSNEEWKTLFETIKNEIIWEYDEKDEDLTNFKKHFKKKVIKRLNHLKEKIGQTLKLYFDNIIFSDDELKLKNGEISIK